MNLGNPLLLQQRYGSLKTTPLNFNLPPKPYFKKITTLRITLPLEPSLQIKPIEIQQKEVEEGKTNPILELFHFVDVAKLLPGRSGIKIKSYPLKTLQVFSEKTNLPKSTDKKENVANIKSELFKWFGNQSNLIGQIKEYEKLTLKQIEELFIANEISSVTSSHLLKELKRLHGNNIPYEKVIEVLEKQWVPILIT